MRRQPTQANSCLQPLQHMYGQKPASNSQKPANCLNRLYWFHGVEVLNQYGPALEAILFFQGLGRENCTESVGCNKISTAYWFSIVSLAVLFLVWKGPLSKDEQNCRKNGGRSPCKKKWKKGSSPSFPKPWAEGWGEGSTPFWEVSVHMSGGGSYYQNSCRSRFSGTVAFQTRVAHFCFCLARVKMLFVETTAFRNQNPQFTPLRSTDEVCAPLKTCIVPKEPPNQENKKTTSRVTENFSQQQNRTMRLLKHQERAFCRGPVPGTGLPQTPGNLSKL